MNAHRFTRAAAALAAMAAIAAGCLAQAGCASSGDESGGLPPGTPPSETLAPPASPDSPSSPTAGPANGDPHAFQQ